MPRPTKKDFTHLLIDSGEYTEDLLHKVVPLVYSELRNLASKHLRQERRDHTLQTTGLVHEVYLKLSNQQNLQFQNKAQFFQIAAKAMRQILVDYARKHRAAKRGGGQTKIIIDDLSHLADKDQPDVLALDQALTRLAEIDNRKSRLVELRYFTGLTIEETAEVLGTSKATVKRDWNFARAWLFKEIYSY